MGTFTLSADGSAVVFFSSTHYTNGGTKDDVSGSGSVRMAHVDLNTGIFQTLSDTTSNYTDLVISADGSRVAFRSNNDLTGQNSDGGFEVFTVEFNGSPSYVQATNATSGGVRAVGIDDSGKVYLRTARDIQGLNPSGLQNIFQYDLTSGTYVNVTGKTASETIDNYMLTADGSALMILTKADLTGENPNNYTQAFRYELHLGTVRQVTNFDSELSKDAASGQFSYDGHSLLISQTNITAEFLSLSLVPENSELDVELGSGAEGRIASALHALNGSLRGLGGFMISSQSAALGALDRVNSNIDEAAQILGVLGAALNRFSIADSVLDKSALEFAAARSRITDVDVAEESANLLRGQIVQQTASALLAQANVQPQLALILLGGI